MPSDFDFIPGTHASRSMPEPEPEDLRYDWGADLRMALSCGVPLLLTAGAQSARRLATEVAFDRRASLVIIECGQSDVAESLAALRPFPDGVCDARSVVLLNEVHQLNPRAQSALMATLEAWMWQPCRPLFMASSPVPLYQFVDGGRFDARLFYRLNAISIALPEAQGCGNPRPI